METERVDNGYHVEVILFDLDGTLIEPSIDFAVMKERVLDVATEWGVDTSDWAEWPVLEIMARIEKELARKGAEAVRGFAQSANRAIMKLEIEAACSVRPYRGVPEMLDELANSGYAVGIVTRNCRAAVGQILVRHPLRHDVLLTRDDVRHVKPDPRHLQEALEQMGMHGRSALMCGDHPMDVMAGQNIGAITAGVLRPGVTPGYWSEVRPDLILEYVTDLPRYLAPRGPG